MHGQENLLSLPYNVKTNKFKMIFGNKIKELREQQCLPQRQLAAALNIDTATYCKIEKGDRKAKREQVYVIADELTYDRHDLVNIWLAEKVYDIIKDEGDVEKTVNTLNLKLVEYIKCNL